MANLSKKDADWLVNQITQKTGGVKACLECGQGGFTLSEELAFVPQIHLKPEGNNIEIGTGSAFALVSCNNCGFSKLYNAGLLGFAPGIGGS